MQAWALSHRGKIRKVNQDAYYFEAIGEDTVALVCDGMGGAAAGDTASRLAAQAFAGELRLPPKNIPERLLWAVDRANDAVYDHAHKHAECEGMGTTLVAAMVRKKTAYVINIGDSRCYYLDKDGICQVTQDHSVVAELLRRGEITQEQAKTHPNRNMITRALGSEAYCRPELFQVQMKRDGMLLLCSDGLSNLVSEQEILFEALYGGAPQTVCQRLVELALRRGAPDNITVVFLRSEDRAG